VSWILNVDKATVASAAGELSLSLVEKGMTVGRNAAKAGETLCTLVHVAEAGPVLTAITVRGIHVCFCESIGFCDTFLCDDISYADSVRDPSEDAP
jgi:hypothetical protein